MQHISDLGTTCGRSIALAYEKIHNHDDRMGRMPSASFLVHRLETSGFAPKKPLYIATEPFRPEGYFKPFEKKWKVFYSTSFRHLIR